MPLYPSATPEYVLFLQKTNVPAYFLEHTFYPTKPLAWRERRILPILYRADGYNRTGILAKEFARLFKDDGQTELADLAHDIGEYTHGGKIGFIDILRLEQRCAGTFGNHLPPLPKPCTTEGCRMPAYKWTALTKVHLGAKSCEPT